MTETRRAVQEERSFDGYADLYNNSAYAEFDQEHRRGGSFGVTLMRVAQKPYDLIDPGTPDIVFAFNHSSGREAGFDLGDGLKMFRDYPSNGMGFIPEYTEQRSFLREPHEVTLVSLPAQVWDTIRDRVGASKSAFFPYIGGSFDYPREALHLAQKMWAVSRYSHPRDDLLLDGLTLQFLAILCADKNLSPLAPTHPEDSRIARVIDYAEAHLGEALTVAELAGVACLSAGHFSRAFKATTGEAVWAYVQRRRVERAMEMLRYTDLPIAEIAYACGFAHQGHLTTCFKRQFKMTPGQVRR